MEGKFKFSDGCLKLKQEFVLAVIRINKKGWISVSIFGPSNKKCEPQFELTHSIDAADFETRSDLRGQSVVGPLYITHTDRCFRRCICETYRMVHLATLCMIHVLVDESNVPSNFSCVILTTLLWNSLKNALQREFQALWFFIHKGIELPRRRQGPFWSSVSTLKDNCKCLLSMCGLALIH